MQINRNKKHHLSSPMNLDDVFLIVNYGVTITFLCHSSFKAFVATFPTVRP